MSARSVAALLTFLVVMALGGAFAVLHRDRAEWLAVAVAALAGVAAVGVAVWAALPGRGSAGVQVSGTGPAIAGRGGTAVSGLKGPASAPIGRVEVERTGTADASGGGEATTGADLT